jgi:hypothetical protein
VPEIFLGEIGSRVNLRAAYGAAFPPFTMQAAYADNTPIDLTSASLSACAWVPGAPIARQILTTALVNGPQGIFNLSITQQGVAALYALDTLRRTAPFILEWATYLQADDNVYARRIFYGSLLLY